MIVIEGTFNELYELWHWVFQHEIVGFVAGVMTKQRKSVCDGGTKIVSGFY